MGPGDRSFVRWAQRYIPTKDAWRVLVAYKKANLVAVDNRKGTFRVIDRKACQRESLKAAAENLCPARRPERWNGLSDKERQERIATLRPLPEQWEKQERLELAIAKLNKSPS